MRADKTYDELKADEAERKAVHLKISLAKIAEANKVLFLRECEKNGIDPAKGVSPSLLATILNAG